MSDTDATVLKLPDEPKTMRWEDLPHGVRVLLTNEFEARMRENFDIEHEVVVHFLEHEVAEQWADFKEQWFQHEMRSADTACAWDDFLDEHGVI